MIARKSATIVNLIDENSDLKSNLYAIDGQLAELKDGASDMRLFHRELVKAIKDIDQNYPLSFASVSNKKSTRALHDILDYDAQPHYNTHTGLQSTGESIFKLSSEQKDLQFSAANLLGRALSMREILHKTPSMIPVSGGYISSVFGPRLDPISGLRKNHNGIDIAGVPIGTPVFASADGQVFFAGSNRDLGYHTEIKHENGFTSLYAHLSKVLVKKGERVKRGQVVGLVGNSGLRCAGTHLHFALKRFGVPTDPKPFMVGTPPTLF